MNLVTFLSKYLSGRSFLPFFILISAMCKAQGENVSLHVISYPETFPKKVVEDIQNLLHLSTGQYWETQQGKVSNTGLIISEKTSGNYKTGESCLINSDGS